MDTAEPVLTTVSFSSRKFLRLNGPIATVDAIACGVPFESRHLAGLHGEPDPLVPFAKSGGAPSRYLPGRPPQPAQFDIGPHAGNHLFFLIWLADHVQRPDLQACLLSGQILSRSDE